MTSAGPPNDRPPKPPRRRCDYPGCDREPFLSKDWCTTCREHNGAPQPSLPAERDVVHSLSDTKGSDDTTTPAAPAGRDEPVTAAGREFEARFNDPTTRPRHLHDVRPAVLAIEREAATHPSVEALAEALCDWGEIDEQFDYGDFASVTTAREYAERILARLSPPTDTGAEQPCPVCEGWGAWCDKHRPISNAATIPISGAEREGIVPAERAKRIAIQHYAEDGRPISAEEAMERLR